MNNIKEAIASFFEKENIEYFVTLPYTAVRETSPEIMAREDFTPKSVILFLLPYYGGETVNISRYSAARDYHIVIKGVTDRLSLLIKEQIPEARAKGYGDHSPIDECNAALIGGLGIIGDNGLIINEKYGSYVFIGDLVTSISPEILGASEPQAIKGCIHCGACKAACPTDILAGKGNECLSAITQRKGELTEEEIGLMKKYNPAWGCDLCQSSCPYNKNPKITPISFFLEDRIEELTLEMLEKMDKAAFNQRAFAWRGRKTVQRNLTLLENE